MNPPAVAWLAELPHDRLTPLDFRILLMLAVRPPGAMLTVAEASAILGCPLNSIGTRFTSLRRAGLVREHRPRPAGTRGRPASRYTLSLPAGVDAPSG